MTTITTLSDSELLRRVRSELDWNQRAHAPDVAATVRKGIVTLAGCIDTYGRKQAVIHAIQHLAGVLDVVDEIQVSAPIGGRTDQEVAQAVRAALIWDVFVPEDRIRSTVSGGWVTLEGTVDRWQQREDAARCVERLVGICGVTNHIEVRPPPIDAGRMRTSIEDALARRARREARRIHVAVADGVVTLTGCVDSWAEKNAVSQLAAYSQGVRRVVDHISVDPYS